MIQDTAEVSPELACPITPVVDIIFSRWTTPILWTLNAFGRHRFVELERRITTITPKVLTQRLRQLERDGLVVRTYHAGVPPRVEYEISDLGRSLAPLFAALAEWSVNLDKVQQSRQDYDDRDRTPARGPDGVRGAGPPGHVRSGSSPGGAGRGPGGAGGRRG